MRLRSRGRGHEENCIQWGFGNGMVAFYGVLELRKGKGGLLLSYFAACSFAVCVTV
jgi:hypothetical protein